MYPFSVKGNCKYMGFAIAFYGERVQIAGTSAKHSLTHMVGIKVWKSVKSTKSKVADKRIYGLP